MSPDLRAYAPPAARLRRSRTAAGPRAPPEQTAEQVAKALTDGGRTSGKIAVMFSRIGAATDGLPKLTRFGRVTFHKTYQDAKSQEARGKEAECKP